jgi:hypothetical protein
MMNPKIIKAFVLGAIAAYAGAAFVLLSSAKLGVLRSADVAPSRRRRDCLAQRSTPQSRVTLQAALIRAVIG